MNELKVYYCHLLHNEYTEFYSKSEADAVIADLKDKCQMHDFFWDGCGFAKRGFKNTIAVIEAFDKLEAENHELKRALYNKNKELRQQKYKRCLDKADLCTVRATVSRAVHWDDRKFNHYFKWHDRWLILADKIYKEAK